MQSQANREYGLAHGAPPVAAGTILVDFDGTLFPWADLFEENPPLPGAVDAMRRFREAGLTIYIFTSRVSQVWLDHEGEDREKHIAHITKMCNRYDIPFDGITADKRPAVAYVDDNAERLVSQPNKTRDAKFSNWKVIADKYAKGTKHEHEFFTLVQDGPNPRYAYCTCGKVRLRQDHESYSSYYAADQDDGSYFNPAHPD